MWNACASCPCSGAPAAVEVLQEWRVICRYGGGGFGTPKFWCLVYSCGKHSPWDTQQIRKKIARNPHWGHKIMLWDTEEEFCGMRTGIGTDPDMQYTGTSASRRKKNVSCQLSFQDPCHPPAPRPVAAAEFEGKLEVLRQQLEAKDLHLQTSEGHIEQLQAEVCTGTPRSHGSVVEAPPRAPPCPIRFIRSALRRRVRRSCKPKRTS